MSSAEPFPLFFPAEARRAFESDDAARRIATVARLGTGSRVLELAAGRGGAAIVFAKEFGCEVVAAEADDAAIAQLHERIRSHGLHDRIEVKKLDYARLPYPEAEFDAIVIQGQVLYRAATIAKELRKHLAANGRIVFTYPAKVGRFPAKAAVEFWEGRLGEALMLPREILGLLQRSGFEPESIETLNDAELAELYRQVDGKLDGSPRAAPLKAEIEHFRAQGKASVSYALAIARRKEPGEKPPASRDRG